MGICYFFRMSPNPPPEFSIQRWLDELPDDDIEREMAELNEQISALASRQNTLREALELKRRFRDFYGPASRTTVKNSASMPIETQAVRTVTTVGSGETPRPSSIGKSLLLVMASNPAKAEWSVSELSDGLIGRGWLDDSEKSQRSLGAALSRMLKAGEIRRPSRGRYAPAATGAATPSLLDSGEDEHD